MSYKTNLVDAAPSPRAEAIATCAVRIALDQQAHLVGLASTGIKPMMYQCSAAAPGVPLSPDDLSALTAAARQALARFTLTATRLGAPSCEERLTDDSQADAMVLHARYCDLVVVGQENHIALAPSSDDILPQKLILHCPRPVLVVPRAGRFEQVGMRPLLAWNGDMAACRAIQGALPLLRRAALATLAVVNPTQVYGAHGEQPGADLASYLARHGVLVDVVVRQTDGHVGDALLSLAAEIGADVLVMGCYGHTRLRELLLGGATRDILAGMTLPVLMAR
jgi:nucleotide-binding universal stress UspA family protein